MLELGTLQSVPGRSTMHRDWVPHASEFLGTDIEAGPDVDVVADLHRLSDVVGSERFDVIISASTFEHLKYPTLAAHELMKALKVGGQIYVQTHQSFPLHGYPNDYFRFSQDALASLFGTRMGFEVIATNYDFPRPPLRAQGQGRAAHAGVPQHDPLGREARPDAGRVPLRALGPVAQQPRDVLRHAARHVPRPPCSRRSARMSGYWP